MMFGRMYNETLAILSFVLIFIGFNVTFFPQFILGAMGMPRRYFDYLPAYHELNAVSSVGAWMIGLGFIVGLITILQSIFYGEKAPDNPWGAKTLEWQTSSPPPHENFYETPQVTGGPYEFR